MQRKRKRSHRAKRILLHSQSCTPPDQAGGHHDHDYDGNNDDHDQGGGHDYHDQGGGHDYHDQGGGHDYHDFDGNNEDHDQDHEYRNDQDQVMIMMITKMKKF